MNNLTITLCRNCLTSYDETTGRGCERCRSLGEDDAGKEHRDGFSEAMRRLPAGPESVWLNHSKVWRNQ